MNQDFRFGFCVTGGVNKPRRVVDWRKAFEQHCAAELDHGEGFLSSWCYGNELVAHMKETGGVAHFDGPMWAKYITLDIDGGETDPVPDALKRTQALLATLETKYSAHMEFVLCWFSGSKGFHIQLPTHGLLTEPGPHFHRMARNFADLLGQETGCGPDLVIYDPVRIIRAPNTRHPITGLFKVRIAADELLRMGPDAVLRLAAEPIPFEPPDPESAWCDGNMANLWNRAESMRAEQPVAYPAPADRTQLNRATLDFIRNGAAIGERVPRSFQAAANLAEFGADERLATALLLPAALDSGLAPAEARRAIVGGVKHMRKKGGT